MSLNDDLGDLQSAEEFLEHFAIPYDARVLQVNRLHILKRFHDYLARERPEGDAALRHRIYEDHLRRAYQDFVESDALTEKVFKVFHMHEPRTVFVPLTGIRRSPSS